MRSRSWKGAIGAFALLWIVAAPSAAGAASFLGLQPGDLIDSITYDSPLAGVVYTSSDGHLNVTGYATAINTVLGDVYGEIFGGQFVVDMDFLSESLVPNGDGTFTYTATLLGAAGLTDVELYAPDCTLPGCSVGAPNDPESDGYDPEQDGRLLITGDFTSPITLQSIIDPSLSAQTFSLSGFFAVTGGDAQFIQAYGPVGSISFVGGGVDNFSPPLTGPGGNLDPPTDTEVFDQDFTAHVKGAVLPQESAPFEPIPEPSTLALLSVGLGWLARRVRR
jgi:hypothetical protein